MRSRVGRYLEQYLRDVICMCACVQDSLGGDAKALMFCNLAPQPLHVSETLSSLAFASKVSSVVLKTPTRRVEEARDEGEDGAASGGNLMTPPPVGGGRGGNPTPRTRTPVTQNGWAA